jgi:alginate O-acetyltransferase complex protein AlgI
MSFQEIAILALFSLLLGWITRRGQRENLLLVSSIVFIYWLQPGMTLRYLDFWLPTATLFVTILSWVITAQPKVRKQGKNMRTAILIIFFVIGMGLVRNLDLGGFLGFLHPPRMWQIVLFTILVMGFFLIQLNAKKISPGALWVTFTGLIFIFIIIKTPLLSQNASALWRSLVGQSVALAGAEEIRWLGFSYLAFRILHTIRDRQSGRLPDIMLREYVLYIVFFPSFVAGPIDRAQNFIKSIGQTTCTYREDLIKGGERLIVGLFKKFVIADSLAIIALNNQNAIQANSALSSWVLLYAFSLQIFFDFSGYTDIAIGLGHFFNIHLPENFKQPYLKPNLTQFWNNWHMTLTNWFRSYFFYPLSRTMRRKQRYSATMILMITQISTMVLVGLWHGVTASFVFWGMWHGLGLLVQNRWSSFAKLKIAKFEESSGLKEIINGLGVFLTFHYVALGWIWFVLPEPSQGWIFFKSLFGAT